MSKTKTVIALCTLVAGDPKSPVLVAPGSPAEFEADEADRLVAIGAAEPAPAPAAAKKTAP